MAARNGHYVRSSIILTSPNFTIFSIVQFITYLYCSNIKVQRGAEGKQEHEHASTFSEVVGSILALDSKCQSHEVAKPHKTAKHRTILLSRIQKELYSRKKRVLYHARNYCFLVCLMSQDILLFLLENGSNIDARNANLSTAFFNAVEGLHRGISQVGDISQKFLFDLSLFRIFI